MSDWQAPQPTLKDVFLLHERMRQEFSVCVIAGFELEFYTDVSRIDELYDSVHSQLESHDISLVEWLKEDGEGQWECAIAHGVIDTSLPKYIKLQEILLKNAEALSIPLCFDGKPYHDQPASGLHVHLHLEDESGKRLFTKRDADMSDFLSYALSGLLRMMPASMPYFMPSAESYARLREGEHVPSHICWGMNNRSTALRIPEQKTAEKHIEHRVCSADANPIAAVWAILVGLHVGLSKALALPEPIYGMARDAQYDAPLLPRSQEEAQRAFEGDAWMKHYSEALEASV